MESLYKIKTIETELSNLKKLCSEEKYEEAYKLISNIEEPKQDSEYLDIKYEVFLATNRIDDLLDELKRALNSRPSKKHKYLIKIMLGKIYFWKGQYIRAQQYLEDCLNYFTKKNENEIIGHIYYFLGYMSFQRNNYEIADTYYDKAMRHYSIAKSKSRKNLGLIYLMKGILSYRTGKFNDSIKRLLRAHKLLRESKKKWEINIRLTFGRALLMKGSLNRAEKFLRWSVEETGKYGYKRLEALANEFLGELEFHRGNFREALKLLLHAKKISFDIAPRGDIAVEVLRRLGEVYIALNKLPRAEKALIDALEVSESLEDRYERGAILRAFAVLHSKLDKEDTSRAYFRESIITLRLIKDRLELARTYEAAASESIKLVKDKKALEKEHKALISEARSYCLEAVHLYSSLGLRENISRSRKLLADIDKLANRRSSRAKVAKLSKLSVKDTWLFGGKIVAKSKSMREVISKAEAVATSDVPVLITGETGTGKELIARYIHELSGRKGDFIAVNCASIPGTIFDSEFFGHAKGAFTNAIFHRAGLIESASGGTLFLDEFTELSLRQQAKLLRVLQEKKVRRVGDSRERDVDIRVISASNGDVNYLIEAGKIRKDFYYRICAQKIELTPLRSRREDIKPLIAYYLRELGKDMWIETETLDLLEKYHWPGNVRELLGTLKVLVEVISRDGIIRSSDLPERIRNLVSSELFELSKNGRIKSKKLYGLNAGAIKKLLSETIEKNRGNHSAAARDLGISRTTLYRWLKKLEPEEL